MSAQRANVPNGRASHVRKTNEEKICKETNEKGIKQNARSIEEEVKEKVKL